MADFDPGAVVAVLVGHYAPPSPANLLRAMAEYPDVFMGAVPIGHSGDKIQLPDGRQYDCIVNVSGPPSARRWSCAYIDPNVIPTPDPFALEPGPLDVIDEEITIFSDAGESFESILARERGPLGDPDPILQHAAEAISTSELPMRIDESFGNTIDPAWSAHEAVRRALPEDDPITVVAAAGGQQPEIEAGKNDYVEPEIPPQPVPDPGDPPPTKPPPPDY